MIALFTLSLPMLQLFQLILVVGATERASYKLQK